MSEAASFSRRVVLGFGVGLVLLIFTDAIAVRIGVAPGVIPKLGSSVWITSRAAGVTAFASLTLEIVFGLFISTGAADRDIPRAKTVEIHRWLSSVTLALIAVHALALLFDRFVRFDLLGVIVPLLSPYRSFAVALGVVAAHLAIVVHASFWLRRRIGAKTWRVLHYLSFFVFAAAAAHGISAGTDSSTPAMRALYLTAIMLVGVLSLYRAAAVLGRRRAIR